MINTRVGSPALCAFRKVPKGDLLGSQHPAQKMTKEGSQNGTSDKALLTFPNQHRGLIYRDLSVQWSELF